MKTIIIAGSYHQYRCYLTEHKLNPKDAVYVEQPEQLRSLDKVQVVFYGNWWLNPCHNDPYLNVLEARGSIVVRR